jgi:signal transduction histidine kinase
VADPVLTRLMLDNLLGNAVKYTSKKEDAFIRMGRVDRGRPLSTFAVRDNGVGFDQVDVAQLFRPLSRLHTEQEFAGTGLGLASVARIVELHGGSIRAEGQRSLGASFFFSLPASGRKSAMAMM